MTSSAKKSDDAQSKRFIETARELGCDEDEAAFDEKLRQIAMAKHSGKPSRQSRSPKRKLKKIAKAKPKPQSS
jgi:hypothetical protein